MTDARERRARDELAGIADRAARQNRRWPTGKEIRDRGASRKRRRIVAGGLATVAIVVAVALTNVTTGGGTKPVPASRSAIGTHVGARIGAAVELTAEVDRSQFVDPGSEMKVAAAEEQFSIELLKKLVDNSSTDQLVSPFSLAEALGMLSVGAGGQTGSQIESALHLSGLSAEDQSQGWAALDEDLVAGAISDGDSFQDANSLWTQTGFPIKEAFLASLVKEFGAGVWQVDFAGQPAKAAAAINEWVDQHTDGRIPELLTKQDLEGPVVAALLNAIFFKAQWAVQLLSTSDGMFESPSGPVPATYMSPEGTTQFDAFSGSGAEGVELPYWNGTTQDGGRPPGRYQAVLIMPTSGSLSDFVSGLTPNALDQMFGSMKNQSVTLEVPQISIASNLDLNSTLESMGIVDAFGPAADLSGISPISIQVKEVKQKATLDVTKYGTVASAATAILGIATSLETGILNLDFDHPFLFLVRDSKTGTILFESTVDNPGAGS
jgi:serpin B